MEYQTCSVLTAGPLSAAAQTVMTALRAQYAGGIDRRPHSESADSFGKAPSLSQNRGTFNNTQESHTPNKRLHEQSERQLFKQSSAGEMKLPSQCDLQQLRNRDNTFNPWEADKHGDGRSRGYANEGKLSGFNSGNNIPWLSRSPPEPDPQEEEFFPRNDLVNRGAQQTVMGFPETHGRISPASIEYSEAEVMVHTPPVKRWRFGNLQIPILSCSKQFEEDDSGQKRQGVDPKKNFNNMPFWSFNEKNLVSGETDVDQNPYGERTEKFQFDSVMFGGAHTEMEECSKSQEYHGCLKETPTSGDASQKISHVLAESCRDSATYGGHLPVYDTLGSVKTTDFDQCTEDHEKRSAVETASATEEHVCLHADLYVRQFNIKNDQAESQERSVEPVHSAAFEVTDARQDPKSFSEVGQRGSKVGCVKNMTASAKQSRKWQPPRSSHASSQITLAQELQPPATSSGSKDAKVPISHQAQQSKSTKQHLYTPKTIRNQDNMPIKTATPLKEQESNVMVISNISEAAQQTQFASEVNEHIQLEMDRDEDKTSETAKHTLAFISDPRVCDASHLSQEERMGVLQEAAAARALAATMVYRDGTTQLDPEQKCPPAVCGVLVLLKKSLNSLVLEETGAAEERLLFLSLEQRPVWAQHDLNLQQDLFTSEMLMTMLCGTQVLVCYKSKDLLRTVLRHFSKDLSWKQVNSCQVLDPQIAAWLLDPADSASCFQDLFKKYCTPPTTPTPAQAESRNKKGAHVISSLSRLHRVMVELRNKLETQGLWQLYFCMEQKMIPVLAAMESHMIHVDSDALKKTSEMLGSKMKQLEQEAHQTAGQKFLVSSSSQLRLVLFEKLRLHERCENKKLPRTMLRQQQSTSEAALLQLQDLHPLPKIILEYRQVHKIKSTFLDGILSCTMKTFISSTWNQTSTVSGRLSAKHPNFQALPRQPMQISKTQPTKGEEAELVTVHPRTMFIPREGWTFVSADFCQVELRLLAHLSSDPELLRICQNPEADFFNMLASQWKGISEDSVSAEDREQAKRIVYSVVYGAGKERLSGILGVSAEEASRFQDRFLQKYNKVQTFIQCTVQHCHKYGYVKSIMGRRRSLPHIHSSDWGVRNQAERQAVNFVVQGSAADLCKMAMIHICSLVASSTTLTGRLVAQIHDELLFEVEDSQVEDFAALVRETMESLQRISCLGVSLSVPLKVSVSTGRSWGSMCEVALPHAASTYTTV